METIAQNIITVRKNIAEAARVARRDVKDITLVAVSKTVPLEAIVEAYNAGVTNFGENYVQEALPKINSFNPPDVNWHMIGHVQSNKARHVVANFQYIHTVDTLSIAQKLDQQAAKNGRRSKVLLQVNVSGEESKEGMSPDETTAIAREVVKLKNLEAVGLMTIAPHTENPEEARPVFRSLRLLRDELRKNVPESKWEHLSMGMTNDYKVAIEEGATIIRIGRAIFGERRNP